jgi:GT2 family glycosyltransferase
VDDGWSDALLAGRAEGVILWGTMRTLNTGTPSTTPASPSRGHSAAYGGNMAISRAIVERIGGFDENILAGGSEHDFVLRAVRDAQATVAAAPAAVVHYRVPATPWATLSWQFRKERGRTYMRRKFGPDVFGSRFRSWAGTWVRLLVFTPRAFADPAARLRVADLVGRLLGRCYWSLVPRPLLANPARRRGRWR